MFDFQQRDEGFLVTLDGRGVAHVDTTEIGETNDPRLRVQERISKVLPQEEWKIHFAGHRLTLDQLEALLAELRAKGE